MEYNNFLELTTSDLYAICKNICKQHGEQPLDEQIDEEIEIFYNN
jgi:hypothetical protein